MTVVFKPHTFRSDFVMDTWKDPAAVPVVGDLVWLDEYDIFFEVHSRTISHDGFIWCYVDPVVESEAGA